MISNIVYGQLGKILIILVLILSVALSCKSSLQLPVKRYSQVTTNTSLELRKDSLILKLNNPVHAPVRFEVSSNLQSLRDELPSKWIQLKPLQDSLIVIVDSAFIGKERSDLKLQLRYGNPDLPVKPHMIRLPTPAKKPVKIMQAYNGSFSHFKQTSKFALDFTMSEGDTVYAADPGRVVGVIKDYKFGGNDKRWTDYANFITIYNSRANWFIQYVHLKQNGSFVQVGDSVRVGQVIGLSGKTGYTSKEHLHFNVWKTTDDSVGFESIPTEFIDLGSGKNIKKGDLVRRD